MAISDLFAFFHHHMANVSAMRMVRRGDVAKSICMAILDFQDIASSQQFLDDFNGKPYSMLEPDILCKVVVVSSVQIHTPEAETDIEVPPGHTELPTCPVCLERLDRHISGVITTVRSPLLQTAQSQTCSPGRGATALCACSLVQPHAHGLIAACCRSAITSSTASVCSSGATLPALCAGTASTAVIHPAARSAAHQLTCGSV